jgi:hypothetical protein
VVQTILNLMEGGHHREDRFAILDGPDPARGEAAAIADAFHLIENGPCGIAAEHEIAMKGMDRPAFHGAHRRDKGLRDDLPAKHAIAAGIRRNTAPEIGIELLEIEDAKEVFNRRHGGTVAAGTGCVKPATRDAHISCFPLPGQTRIDRGRRLCDARTRHA